MRGAINWYKRYLAWFWKHKVITAIIVLIVFALAATSGGNSNNQNTADNQVASTNSSQQQTSTDTSQPASQAPTASSQNSNTTQTAPAKPQLRQDLAFQGDPSYCDGIYKDNGNGTTTWSYDIKQNGELITHLSDNNGQIYRHDVQITNAPNYYSFTAPVAIKDVAEIDGVLTVSGDSNGHPCNLSPQQQPQQAY
jgi:hypothetical protein